MFVCPFFGVTMTQAIRDPFPWRRLFMKCARWREIFLSIAHDGQAIKISSDM